MGVGALFGFTGPEVLDTNRRHESQRHKQSSSAAKKFLGLNQIEIENSEGKATIFYAENRTEQEKGIHPPLFEYDFPCVVMYPQKPLCVL